MTDWTELERGSGDEVGIGARGAERGPQTAERGVGRAGGAGGGGGGDRDGDGGDDDDDDDGGVDEDDG